jgi:hypothetical protein
MTVYQKNLKQKVQAYLERLIAYVDSLKETTHTSLDQVLKAQLTLWKKSARNLKLLVNVFVRLNPRPWKKSEN